MLLEAWPAVRARVPGARLVLVGDGPTEPELRAAAGEGVDLVGPRKDVPDWLAAADVVVAPSRWEGMALTLLEAMATGRSVVATEVAGAGEALGDEAGRIVPIESVPGSPRPSPSDCTIQTWPPTKAARGDGGPSSPTTPDDERPHRRSLRGGSRPGARPIGSRRDSRRSPGAVSETHVPDVGTTRILANTVYRGAADVGSKLISIAFFVVLARQLGESGFGVFVFGLTLASMLTVLAGFGQDQVLTREVARDRSRLDEYFANTVTLKLLLALPVLVFSALVMAAVGVDAETLWVVLLLGIALVAEQLASTCFAVYQAFEQLVYVPVVIITQRLITAAAGIAAVLAGASVIAVSVVYLGGALAAMVLAYVLLADRSPGQVSS